MTDSTNFQTRPVRVFLYKFMFPILVFLVAVTVFSNDLNVLVALLLAPLVIFNFSAAELRLGDRVVRYRRFIKWKELSYESILECKAAFYPGMGFLRLDHFVPPLGKIYFVLDGPDWQKVRPGGKSVVAAYINNRSKNSAGPAPGGEKVRTAGIRGPAACVMSASIGCVYSLLVYSLVPESPVNASWSGYPTGIRFLMAIEKLAVGFPWGFITCTMLAVEVIRMRFEIRAWIAAFVFGGLLTSVVIQALKSMKL